jgi:hypothetical protein
MVPIVVNTITKFLENSTCDNTIAAIAAVPASGYAYISLNRCSKSSPRHSSKSGGCEWSCVHHKYWLGTGNCGSRPFAAATQVVNPGYAYRPNSRRGMVSLTSAAYQVVWTSLWPPKAITTLLWLEKSISSSSLHIML